MSIDRFGAVMWIESEADCVPEVVMLMLLWIDGLGVVSAGLLSVGGGKRRIVDVSRRAAAIERRRIQVRQRGAGF